MSVTYVDTSALVKLLVAEAETDAIGAALRSLTVVTSVLAPIELTAVARRRRVTKGEARVAAIVAPLRLVPVSDAVVHSAQAMASHPPLKALDLLHLATARTLGPASATTLIAYDRDLLDAAHAERFAVSSPG